MLYFYLQRVAMFFVLSFIPFLVSARQDWRFQMEDSWYNEYFPRSLKVGEKFPDISLGVVVNNTTGKRRFSEFKGKLVILDFWSTYCSTCMESFPKMEKLQQLYKDFIQIFIVNPFETQAQIDERFSGNLSKKYKLPDLPSIVDARDLFLLFPTRAVPHHVWIDQKGIVAFKGSSLSTNSENISAYLKGDNFFGLLDDNVTPGVLITPLYSKDYERAKTIPYFRVLQQFNNSHPPIVNGSYFTAHNNQYTPFNGHMMEDLVDSISCTIRDTYVNKSVLSLYQSAFTEDITDMNSKLIIGPDFPGYTFVSLNVKDTLKYTNFFHGSVAMRDSDYVKSLFCYESISPMNLHKIERRQRMIKDLNEYFGSKYGAIGYIERRSIPCYLIIRTSKEDKLSLKDKGSKNYSKIDSATTLISKVSHLKNILSSLLAHGVYEKVFSKRFENRPLYMFDATLTEGRVHMKVPPKVNNMDELRSVLRMYDLDVIETTREIKFLVIKDRIHE